MKLTSREVWREIEDYVAKHGWDGAEKLLPSVSGGGGGPSQQQKDAAAAQAELSKQQASTGAENTKLQRDIFNKISPFGTDLMTKGLPFLGALTDFNNGTTARAALPARASLLRSIGGNTSAQPNGFKSGVIGDFDNNLAHDFDSNMGNTLMANENAKLQGANILSGQQGVLNPLGWSSAAGNSNNSIMQAPLSTPSPFGAIAGAAGTLGGAAITKF